MIKIKPVTVAFEVEANYVELKQGGYILGTNEECKVKVMFFKDTNLVHDQKIVVIPQELVENWTDDEPIIEWVLNELGLIKIEEEEMII